MHLAVLGPLTVTSTGGRPVDLGGPRLRALWPPTPDLDRLLAVKRRVDPADVFRTGLAIGC